MKKVISSGRIPIKMWLEDVDQGAIDQAKNLASLPFSFKHIALMPDTHQGYGMPIGGVMAAKGYVIPNAVGVDIGCGMLYQGTSKTREEFEPYLKDIITAIKHKVPVGFKSHEKSIATMPDIPQHVNFIQSMLYKSNSLGEKSAKQIGTLGSGNHFIEIQEDDQGKVGIMIHSGSRNLGHTIAGIFNGVAKLKNEQWKSGTPPSHDLAYLPLSTDEGMAYMEAMQYCVDWAEMNRHVMLRTIVLIIDSFIDDMEWTDTINIAHNYARMENHFGENVMVHRKGATSAKKGEIGIVPGSQGTSSYIVEGLGNPESFMSCSHGAGRNMGRNQAKKELDFDIEMKKMDGIIHGMVSESDLDEAPGAYKDIDTVMDNQSDLVKIIKKLTPLAVVKG